MKVIDMHCDTISEILSGREHGKEMTIRKNDRMVDLEKMKQGSYSVQNFALFVEMKEGESPYRRVNQLLDVFREEMHCNRDRIRQVYTTSDILQNEAAGRLSALLTVEEGGVCEGKLENLYALYEQGVRMMTLTWNFPNALGYPNFNSKRDYYTPNVEDGLTELGFRFVEEMERIGMIIDVSHLSDAGFYDVLRVTKRPFVASHSNARAVCPCVRNMTDDMIRKLAERGGVIGLNYCVDFLRDSAKHESDKQSGQTEKCLKGGINLEDQELQGFGRRPKEGYASLEDIAKHARHMAQVGGIECVGLGSDFDGIPTNPELTGADEIPKLAAALAKEGFHESEIDQILYGNVFRLYREILG